MESIFMTNATHVSRVRFVCPQADTIRLAVTSGFAQGTTVSAARPTSMDVAYLRTGEPPV
jgi:hypothetical protein